MTPKHGTGHDTGDAHGQAASHGNEHHGNEHHGNEHHGNEHHGNEHHGNEHAAGHGDEHGGRNVTGHAGKTPGGHRGGHRSISRTPVVLAAPPDAVSLAGWLRGTAVVVLLAVVLLPFFFVIYRLTLFGTVAHDDYAPFLLGLLGLPGGEIPGSPHGYRALSVLAAVPFYYVLPPLPLTNAPAGLSPYFIRATGALALLSHLSLAGSLYAAYRLARDRAGKDAATALLAAGLLFVLCCYSQFFALDPVTILLITVGLYLLETWQGFAILLLATPAINENIAIVFAVWLTLRCATSQADREALALQWAAAMAALLLYATLITFVHLPGSSYYHLEPDAYLETLRRNLAFQASADGLLLNLLPTALLLGLGLLGHFGRRRRKTAPLPWRGLFRPVDLLMIPAMLGIALVFMPFFQVGRILMYAAPLFVVPAATVLLHRIAGEPSPRTTGQGQPAGESHGS